MEPPWRYTPYQPKGTKMNDNAPHNKTARVEDFAKNDRDTTRRFERAVAYAREHNEPDPEGWANDAMEVIDSVDSRLNRARAYRVDTESEIDRKMRESMASVADGEEANPFNKPDDWEERSAWSRFWWATGRILLGVILMGSAVVGLAFFIAVLARGAQLGVELIGFFVRLMGG